MIPRNYYVLIGAAAAAFILLSTLINRSISSNLQIPAQAKPVAANDLLTTQKELPAEDLENSAPIKSFERHSLTPDDPAKFGILVQKEGDAHSANLWENNIQKTLVSSGAINEMEKSGAFSGTGFTAKEIERRTRLIDDRIKEQQRIVQADPSDDGARIKLQNLFMVKATFSALQGKLTPVSSSK